MAENITTEIDVADFESANFLKSLVELECFEENSDEFNSPKFLERDSLLKGLLNPDEHKSPSFFQFEEFSEKQVSLTELPTTVSSDKIILSGWKNVENISSRLIEKYDETVVLECLIDRESGIYEERIFRSSLFSEYNLCEGQLFYLRFFERKNEIKMEVHDGLGIVQETDFPKFNFVEKFKNSKLF
jgi:hypothetical protein